MDDRGLRRRFKSNHRRHQPLRALGQCGHRLRCQQPGCDDAIGLQRAHECQCFPVPIGTLAGRRSPRGAQPRRRKSSEYGRAIAAGLRPASSLNQISRRAGIPRDSACYQRALIAAQDGEILGVRLLIIAASCYAQAGARAQIGEHQRVAPGDAEHVEHWRVLETGNPAICQ